MIAILVVCHAATGCLAASAIRGTNEFLGLHLNLEAVKLLTSRFGGWPKILALQSSPDPLSGWRLGVAIFAAMVSLLALAVSVWALKRTGKIADRTVRVEAQKLLLEINKSLITTPKLFSVLDNEQSAGGERKNCPEESAPCKNGCPEDECRKLRAFAYMNLNVFEIVLAVHPKGEEATAWRRYFKETLKNSKITRTVLLENSDVYSDQLIIKAFSLHQNLMEGYVPKNHKKDLKRLYHLRTKALGKQTEEHSEQVAIHRNRSDFLLWISKTLRAESEDLLISAKQWNEEAHEWRKLSQKWAQE
jgi:HAMP domain-containing protein